MSTPMNLEQINRKIQHLKLTAGDLHQESQGYPALVKNLERILVSIRMLELNVSDLLDSGPLDECE